MSPNERDRDGGTGAGAAKGSAPRTGAENAVDEASAESFPASDPPAWTSVDGERSGSAPAERGAAAGGAVWRSSPDDGGAVARLEAEVADLKDRLLRALAEQENLRRRAAREREEAVRFAASSLARDLLPTADNLRRAIESASGEQAMTDPTTGTLLDGVAATERALLDILEKHGIRRIDPQPGETFDPHRHQAMLAVEGSGQPAGAVTEVLQAGYSHHERLLRPALVGVAKGESALDAGSRSRQQANPDHGGHR